MEPPSEMVHWGLACSKTPLHRQGVEGTAQAQKLFLMPQTCARLAMPSASIDRPSGQPVTLGNAVQACHTPKPPSRRSIPNSTFPADCESCLARGSVHGDTSGRAIGGGRQLRGPCSKTGRIGFSA